MSAGLVTSVTMAGVVAALLRFAVTPAPASSGVRPAGRSLRPSDKFALIAICSFLVCAPLVIAAPQAPFVAVCIGVGAIVALFDPVLAVSFLLSVLVVRPWEVYPDVRILLYVPRALALIAVASFALWASMRNEKPLRYNAFFVRFLLFLGWITIASLFGAAPAASLDYITTTFVPISVVLFLVVNCFTEARHLRLLRTVLLVSIAGVIANALWLTLFSGTVPPEERLQGFGLWGNANDLAALIALAFPLAIFDGRAREETRYPVAGLIGRMAVSVLFIAGLWYSQSRGGLYALGAASVGYALFCRSSWLSRLAVGGLCAVLAVILLAGVTRDEAELQSSSTARWNYVITAVRMARSNPVFGVGVNNFPELYESFTPAYEETGNRAAHSSWMLALAESGPIGFLLFVSLMIWAFKWAWRLRKARPDIFTALIGYGCAMSFLSHTYTILPYLAGALVLIAVRVEVGKQPVEEREAGPVRGRRLCAA